MPKNLSCNSDLIQEWTKNGDWSDSVPVFFFGGRGDLARDACRKFFVQNHPVQPNCQPSNENFFRKQAWLISFAKLHLRKLVPHPTSLKKLSHHMKQTLTTLSALLLAIGLMAQSSANYWQDMPLGQMDLPEDAALEFSVNHSRTLSLNFDGLGEYLKNAPMEFTEAARTAPLLLELPMPDGTVEQFGVWESPIMEPGLAAKFPTIKTYAGKSLERSGVTVRFDHTPEGFHASVQAPGATVHLTPYVAGQSEFYKSYFLKDVDLSGANALFSCGVHGGESGATSSEIANLPKGKNGEETDGRSVEVPFDLLTYRLAVATTVEYSQAWGNTPTSVMSAVTTVVNNVNGVFERDVAIRLNLVDNTDEVFYFGSAGSDPFMNGDEGMMINQNVDVMNDNIGIDNYDIGHVFGTNSGGLASLGSVCSGTQKARGASGSFGAYTTDLFYIIVGHEIGHQFNAQHNFNFCNADDDFESPDSAYEPGSGASIMCYNGNGVCGSNHTQPTSDPYFHINAMERIRAYSTNPATGGACEQLVEIGNNSPEASVPFGNGVVIPISTPFELLGEATDPEGDNMTYSWEQYDLGPESPLGNPSGSAPAFRSFPPSNSPMRVFPMMERVVNNISHPHEVLPTYSRVLTFRFTVRDNNDEVGAYTFEEIQFNANENAGPFLVSAPNDGTEVWEVGDYVEVTWDVANTDGPQVNCQNVNILLSTDGGYNYPVALLSGTPNDGSAFVVVPDEVGDQVRVRVEAADNIFFDISNEDFSIVPPAEPGYALVSSPELGRACTPEVFDVNLETTALLGFAEDITFSVDGLPAGAVPTFSTNPVTPGEGTTLSIDFADVTDDGEFVATITAEANGVPTATRTVTLNVVYNDFSAMQLLEPAGASGTSTLPGFSWSELPNALLYDIQISDTPDFSNLIDEGIGLSAGEFSPNVELEENTVYYWRIASTNECGTGDWSNSGAFKTVSQSCDLTTLEDEQNISAVGLPLIESTINVPTGGTVSDVNVKNIRGAHTAFGHLEFRLKGPDGSTAVLASAAPCFVGLPFDLGFNDQAPIIPFPCPPDDGIDFQPDEPLAIFNDKPSQGDWTLQVEVINTDGEGGNFDGWSIEICGAFQGQDPYLVNNETLAVPPNDSRLIYSDKLLVEDPDNIPNDLDITIVNDVEHGFITRNGVQLGQGDQFTMMDIFASRIEYTNTNPSATDDHFTFSVDDGNGGFFGTPVFDIEIDADAPPSAAGEVMPGKNVLVYPNPTSSLVNIEFLEEVIGGVGLTLTNLQGKVLQLQEFDAAYGKFQLDVSDLPTGLYLLQLNTEAGIFVKKLVVE